MVVVGAGGVYRTYPSIRVIISVLAVPSFGLWDLNPYPYCTEICTLRVWHPSNHSSRLAWTLLMLSVLVPTWIDELTVELWACVGQFRQWLSNVKS